MSEPIEVEKPSAVVFNAILQRATPSERRILVKGGRLSGARMTALAIDAALAEERTNAAGKALAMSLVRWAAKNIERSF